MLVANVCKNIRLLHLHQPIHRQWQICWLTTARLLAEKSRRQRYIKIVPHSYSQTVTLQMFVVTCFVTHSFAFRSAGIRYMASTTGWPKKVPETCSPDMQQSFQCGEKFFHILEMFTLSDASHQSEAFTVSGAVGDANVSEAFRQLPFRFT